jgi:hypothetical protein
MEDLALLALIGIVFGLFVVCVAHTTHTAMRTYTITNTAVMPRSHAKRLVAQIHNLPCEGPLAFPVRRFVDALEAGKNAEVCVVFEDKQRAGLLDAVTRFNLRLRCSFNRVPCGTYEELRRYFPHSEIIE